MWSCIFPWFSSFMANSTRQCIVLLADAVIDRNLKAIAKYCEEGHIQPIKPIKTFTSDTIPEAFLYMQKGQHIGKIVISMPPESRKSLSSTSPPKVAALDQGASYLLVGGLGGLGRPISTWLVRHGARHLIYLSRSAGTTSADIKFIRELESQGCSATTIKGSVADPADVVAAVRAAKGHLKGVVQMSMVLRDQAFTKMTYEEWGDAVSPKVRYHPKHFLLSFYASPKTAIFSEMFYDGEH